MKTQYHVQQELERLERLVPHIVNDQSDHAKEILGSMSSVCWATRQLASMQ